RGRSQANCELFVLNLDAPPVAKELPKILQPLRRVELRKLRSHVLVADLIDLVQGKELVPFDKTLPSNRRIKCREDSFERRFKWLDIRIDLCAFNDGNPFQPLVKLLVLLPAGEKEQKIDRHLQMLGGPRHRHGHGTLRILVTRT